jgi:hypothetical protein
VAAATLSARRTSELPVRTFQAYSAHHYLV